MNPFDLMGPEFLVFYFVSGIVILVTSVVVRRISEDTDASNVRIMDPYLIAYLRGGQHEALRVAAVSLMDRKLLTGDDQIVTANPESIELVRRPIERSILERFKEKAKPAVLFTDVTLSAVLNGYETELIKLRLLPDDSIKAKRRMIFAVTLLVLWGIALTKIILALSRGRTNLEYLIIMAGIFGAITFAISRPRRTRAGDTLLEDMQNLFAGLKNRSLSLSPGGKSNEAAFLAAVFGLAVLPPATFPFAQRLRPQRSTTSSSCSSWTTSSCSSSSSCGSSCGGSCGGGGCGGCGS